VTEVKTPGKSNIASDLRKTLSAVYLELLPPSESALVSGVLFGEKSNFTKKESDLLKNSGLTHLVVASGTNLVFLVTGLNLVLERFLRNKRTRCILITMIVIFYSFLTGFDPPIVRAGIMTLSGFVSVGSGRPVKKYWPLMVAGLILVLCSPEIIYKTSFQLSFAATASQVFAGSLENSLSLGRNLIVKIIFSTLAAQVFTIPILFSSFGYYPVLSLGANVLVLWEVPWLMSLSVIAGISSLTSITMGRILILPVHALGFFFWEVANFFGTKTDFVIRLKWLDMSISILYYVVLAGIVYLTENKAVLNRILDYIYSPKVKPEKLSDIRL
jgi:competence protein ComEC